MNTALIHSVNTLSRLIKSMETQLHRFVNRPGVDFSRSRKISFFKVIEIILSFGRSSLHKEISGVFNFSSDMPSVSAFSQCREKIKISAFQYLFNTFNQLMIRKPKLFKGFRLIAFDGSDLLYPLNLKEVDSAFPASKCNMLHLNAAYDLLNHYFHSVIIKSRRTSGEIVPATDIVSQYNEADPAIFIADRGYECFNLFANIIEKGCYFLIRIKDVDSNGILSKFNFSNDASFDITQDIFLTRSEKLYRSANNSANYRLINPRKRFDFLEKGSKDVYKMSIRFVRFQTAEGKFAVVATNLDEKDFPLEVIKKLYGMRWGIESAFRTLKYAVDLSYFHSKKAEFIIQEVYAKLIMYNLSMFSLSDINPIYKKGKHEKQINITRAVQLCIHWFKNRSNGIPPDWETSVTRSLHPIRKDRSHKRSPKTIGAKGFLYRG